MARTQTASPFRHTADYRTTPYNHHRRIRLEDFILREKITHFDHERIPERIVHARGSGARAHTGTLRPIGR